MNLMNNMAISGIKYVKVISPGKATGKLKQIYDQINHDFAVAPPFTLHSALPDLVAAVWSAERETMFHGIVPRGRKEAIVAAVAIINQCPYCIDAHTLMMQATNEGDAAKILSGQSGNIADLELQQLVNWAKATRTPGASIITNPPFTAEEAPEIIGAALAFHYINRMANIFLDDHMMPEMGFLSGAMRNIMANTMIKSLIQRKIRAGESLQFLPEANLPDEFGWAAQNDVLVRTFAGITATINTHAENLFSEKALATVEACIRQWNGDDIGMSRAWINGLVADLHEQDAAAARLMLLAGLASYQVTETEINHFRQYYPDDAHIIAATAWGAWSAVRRISAWLYAETQEMSSSLNHI
jgi:AhpD family alkylhydroperoxidase